MLKPGILPINARAVQYKRLLEHILSLKKIAEILIGQTTLEVENGALNVMILQHLFNLVLGNLVSALFQELVSSSNQLCNVWCFLNCFGSDGRVRSNLWVTSSGALKILHRSLIDLSNAFCAWSSPSLSKVEAKISPTLLHLILGDGLL